ncbi:MAG: DUF456 domain-containing protein [Kiritimatiellae bacterium]|nr:DUF456 domain-containing protein [Kiritimatiellia bacterium]
MENITVILIIAAAVLLSLFGIIGCILPAMPGVLFSYGALLLLWFTTDVQISNKVLIIFGLLTAVVSVVDTVLPIYLPKKFGSSSYGVAGATIGLIVGLFFPPLGLIIGPLIGAFALEYFKSRKAGDALVAGIGSFFGFMIGTVLKISLSVTITAFILIKGVTLL